MNKIKININNIDIAKIIKKNISIVIPAAIAVAAILLFIPTVMIQGKISKKLQQSQRLGNEVRSVSNSAVSARQLEIIKTYEDKHQQDANEIEKLAIETSQRPLLNYRVFPEPNETSAQIFNEFKRAYGIAFAKLITDMNALDAPTDIEIRKEIGSMKDEMSNVGAAKSLEKSNEKIIELICQKRCEQIPCYANPQVFSGYGFWDNWKYQGVETATRDCWYSQLAYWIHEDVADVIKKINAGSKTVLSSPVKRLLGIRFSSSDAAQAANNAGELPRYLTDKSAKLYQPWTGRISNEQIDVIQFSVAVIIKADDVLKFMNELCSERTHSFSGYRNDEPVRQLEHNQITILQSNIEPVDRESPNHKKYRYGPQAIVQLNLICEYIFNRKGYDIIKPKTVQKDLGATTTTTLDE